MNKKVRIILETLVVGLLVFVLTIFNVNSSLDYIARDRLYQMPRGIDSKIKIIGIDEKTMEELGPIQTWSRGNYARLLEKLNESKDAKPALVGFDILFSGNLDEGDDEFARAAAESGNVIIVNHLIYRDSVKKIGNGLIVSKEVEQLEEPYEGIRAVCKAGFSNVAEDSDGVVRRIIPVEKNQGSDQKMFSTVLYEEYCRIKGITPEAIPVDEYGKSIINYSGRPGDYEYISMSDVLDGRIDTRAFKDSIILVGAYAMGMQDNFKVPTSSQQMYGVEIHANILQSYLQSRFAITGNQYLLGLITAIVAMLLYLMFRKVKLWISLIVMLVTITAEVLVLAAVNNRGYSFSVIYFPLVLILAYFYAIVMNYLLEKARKKKVLNAFKKYVAPEIVDEISRSGDFNVKVGGENRDIAVLFVDIRGFTTMSEALEPEQVVEILNEYLALTTDAIFKNKGTLDKFVGDCTMAVFNSPFDLDDYEFRSVCAAKDIVDGGMALEKTLMEKYGRTVGFGVGVNVGPAVVGNIGCDFRMDFTAIGDTVNTAARLEANAKKGQVLISDVLYERLKGRIEVNPIGEIPLKGKSKGVFVYEVTEVHREDA